MVNSLFLIHVWNPVSMALHQVKRPQYRKTTKKAAAETAARGTGEEKLAGGRSSSPKTRKSGLNSNVHSERASVGATGTKSGGGTSLFPKIRKN
jgi:hypothetical protein